MKTLNKRVFRKLKEAKLQYFAITLVMMVGISIYIIFNMGIFNFENSVNTYYNKTNFYDLKADVVRIPKGAINKLLDIEGVKGVEGRISQEAPVIVDNNKKATIRIVSIPKEKNINKLYVLDGEVRDDSIKNGFLIEQFFEAGNYSIGDEITTQINGKNYHLRIKAKVASPEYVYLMKDAQSMLPDFKKFGILYVSEEFAQDVFSIGEGYNELIFDIEEGYSEKKIKLKIEDELDRYGVKQVITREDQLSNKIVSEEIKGGKKSAGVVPFIFLIVSGIILAVMISRLVKQDRVTIGVLKASGYTNRQILIHYIMFAIIIGFTGSLMGILLGVYVSKYFTLMYLMYYKVHYVTIEYYYIYLFGAIIIAIVFSIISGIYGAKDSLKIMPADSMRKEAPVSGKRVFLEGSKLWDLVSFTKKMVWRNLMRSKKRMFFVAFGVAVTLLVVLIPIYLFGMMPKMFDYQFSVLQQMDYEVDFERPMTDKSLNIISKKVNPDKIEGKLEYPFEISYLWRKKIINIIGIKPTTNMYNFLDINGKKLKMTEDFAFISEAVAKNLNLNVGDKVIIKNYLPGKNDIKVKITGIVKQNLGINMYIPIEKMQKELVEKGSINSALIKSDEIDKEELNQIKGIREVSSVEEMSNSFKEFMKITLASISAMLFFGFILGFVIMYNTTMMTINGRVLEFSSLRVLGMTKFEIIGIILKENFIITILGVIIGLPLGKYYANKISLAFSTDIYTFSGEIQVWMYLVSVGITCLFVLISQIAAYHRIKNLDFIDALKKRMT